MKQNSYTKQLFFELLRAGLWEREARFKQFEEVDFDAVYRLAEEQSVVGLIAAGLDHAKDGNLPQEIVLQIVGEALQIEQQNASMNNFIGALINKLRKSDIYTLLVKGQGTAQCYERPQWRTCGDVDLFLSEDNYDKAKKLLTAIASSVEVESIASKHLGMTIDEWVVELHGKLYSSLSPRINKVLRKIKDDTFYGGNVKSWNNGGVIVFLLAAENDVIYTFTHFLGHFYKGGIGLRQICDWCRLLWTYRASLNREILEKRIRKMGLMSEWKSFGSFAVEYLGMPKDAMPFYSDSPKWSRKAKRICSFIMEVGNFGHKRDTSYFERHPYLIRKIISLGRRSGDLWRHAKIFPLDSLRFFPFIMFHGLRSAARGE